MHGTTWAEGGVASIGEITGRKDKPTGHVDEEVPELVVALVILRSTGL